MKTILHIIYNLGRGGAETMLVQTLKKLPQYHNVVVSLQKDNHFGNELQCDEYICLDTPSLLSLPAAVIKLKKLIKAKKPELVHSHLPLPNFVARMAVPKDIPLISTIHNSIAVSGDYKKWFIRMIDKATYRFRKSTIIAVSKRTMEDYFTILNLKRNNPLLLYNFVDLDNYPTPNYSPPLGPLKLVCVASLSRQKNIAYLVNAFEYLKNENIILDVYGKGELHNELQELISLKKVKVNLQGQVSNIPALLPQYDLYIMSSLFEGFSLSVLEAIAAGLPLLLSDIPSFKEQCGDYAIYFDLNDPQDFAKKLLELGSDQEKLKMMSAKGRSYVEKQFSLDTYMVKLNEIYINHFDPDFSG